MSEPTEFFNKEILCSIFKEKEDEHGVLKPIEEDFKKKIKALSVKAQAALRDEIDKALNAGVDFTFIVTIGGKYYWKPAEFKQWVSHFDLHTECKRITCASNNCVVILTEDDKTVTILFYGNNRVDVHVPEPFRSPDPEPRRKRRRANNYAPPPPAPEDDGFEEDPGFESQQISGLANVKNIHSTPRK
ncbi:expressed unknown protein [Seminavis robusta]|uniref:Uncharacterized protein n=1 Tax=Seminavis robusta TaxID=568900 RepID=A0A9N8D8N7_9STRA|nr:expressed unknown protein [Seminavis robusta]|eukprot:Sro3_g002340.1 n/a (188) ;mRNA; r:124505-125068